MPELPEVECVRRSLLPHIVGTRIEGVRIHRRDVCECRDAGGRITTATPARLLAGDTVVSILRHGKQLALVGESGRVVCVHLGMSGRLSVGPRTLPRERSVHDHVVWLLPQGHTVTFHDPRRFGGVWTFPSEAMFRAVRWQGLGPDALSLSGSHLAATLAKSSRAVKAALLDQSVAAGIGNIYADESLFAASLHPRMRCSRISAERWDVLAEEVRGVLSRAVERGGSTIRDYVNADGRSGSAQALHGVYGRGGLPCPRCAQRLESGIVGQRTTVWCARCQPARLLG